MEFLSCSDPMLFKFINKTVRTHDYKNHVFNYFLLGIELVKDAVYFFGKLYKWLLMLSEYTIDP